MIKTLFDNSDFLEVEADILHALAESHGRYRPENIQKYSSQNVFCVNEQNKITHIHCGKYSEDNYINIKDAIISSDLSYLEYLYLRSEIWKPIDLLKLLSLDAVFYFYLERPKAQSWKGIDMFNISPDLLRSEGYEFRYLGKKGYGRACCSFKKIDNLKIGDKMATEESWNIKIGKKRDREYFRYLFEFDGTYFQLIDYDYYYETDIGVEWDYSEDIIKRYFRKYGVSCASCKEHQKGHRQYEENPLFL